MPITQEIAGRSYGLRDFIIVDPDGFWLPFASPVTRGKGGVQRGEAPLPGVWGLS